MNENENAQNDEYISIPYKLLVLVKECSNRSNYAKQNYYTA